MNAERFIKIVRKYTRSKELTAYSPPGVCRKDLPCMKPRILMASAYRPLTSSTAPLAKLACPANKSNPSGTLVKCRMEAAKISALLIFFVVRHKQMWKVAICFLFSQKLHEIIKIRLYSSSQRRYHNIIRPKKAMNQRAQIPWSSTIQGIIKQGKSFCQNMI